MKISVALCSYNGERFLRLQVESILRQWTPVDEIIICDDNSSDNTRCILKEYETRYGGLITVYYNKENIGVVKNFEKAISLCTGDLIFLSDQDDEWNLGKVEKCVLFFQNNPDIYGLFTNAFFINESGDLLNKTLWELLDFHDTGLEKRSLNLFRFMLLYGNVIAGNCLALRSESKKLILPFRYIKNMWHDEWIGMKLAEYGRMHYLNEPLIKYRMHDDQQTKYLWDNRGEKNKIRASFMEKRADLYPFDYYKHWRRRYEAIQELIENGFKINNLFLKEITEERKRGFLIYLKKYPFFKRKLTLFKLWVKGKEMIFFWDLIKY